MDIKTQITWLRCFDDNELDQRIAAKCADTMEKLHAALQAASDHLDYCGYGDSWERECAVAEGLEKQISAALEVK